MNPEIANTLYLAHPMINVLVAIYHAISFIHIPYALGFSIIALTIVIRLLLYPLTSAQLKAAKKMQDLSPHLSKLKEKHKKDAKMLQSETMRLYKEHGVNPLAGCLPVVLQLPIIWGLYTVLNDIVKYPVASINKVLYSDSLRLTKQWDTTFFGLPLAQHPSQLIHIDQPATLIFLLIPVLTGVFQFIQSKMMLPQESLVPVKKDEKKADDFASSFQKQSLYIFPVMIGFFSFNFPIGLSLYWNTFTIFGIIQQYKISGLGGLKDWTDKINGRKK
jgi:YidC/Oxa1 family membrane protein insertase